MNIPLITAPSGLLVRAESSFILMMESSLETRPTTKSFRFFPVLFNMHDTDNDGTITLEEYRKVRKPFMCLFFSVLHKVTHKCITCVLMDIIFVVYKLAIIKNVPSSPAFSLDSIYVQVLLLKKAGAVLQLQKK